MVPTSEDATLAREALESLIVSTQSAPFKLQFQTNRASSESVTLPLSAVKLLMEILREIAADDAVGFVPIRNEVTTQETAEILNVFRPFLIGLLEKARKSHATGRQSSPDPSLPLLQHKRKNAAIREEALDQLTAEAQELKLYEPRLAPLPQYWTPVSYIQRGSGTFFSTWEQRISSARSGRSIHEEWITNVLARRPDLTVRSSRELEPL